MALSLTRGVKCVAKSSSSVSTGWEWLLVLRSSSNRCYAAAKAKASSSSSSSLNGATMRESSIPSSEKEDLEDLVPTSGISRPLSEILKELNKKVPDSLIRVRTESDGFPAKYIPWHIVNRIMNLHAPEWSGEVRSITYSADGKSVFVVYHVMLYGADAE
ncbi:unnamed protein product [Camellia sinensis]